MFDEQLTPVKILIGNITDKVSRHDIDGRFSKYGKIIGIQMLGSSAKVAYESEDVAAQAIRQEHMTQMRDCRLDVTLLNEKHNNNNRIGHSASSGNGGGRRSPSNERFRDRGMMGGRGDRFRDEPLQSRPAFDDNFRNMGGGPLRGSDGESFPKHPRFEGTRDSMAQMGPNSFAPDYYKEEFLGIAGPPVPLKVNDCEIIVLSKLQQNYAELIELRLKNIGLTVDLMFVRDDASILRAVNDMARRGSFYSVIISHQSEVHGSLTLNILQGPSPQEHRNMPLDDALKLIARTFGQMRQEKRGGGQSPVDREIQFMLNLLMNGKYLTIPELDKILRFVQEIRDRQSSAEKIGLPVSGINIDAGRPPNTPTVPNKQPDADNSLMEQQNLQQRILSIISQGNQSTDQRSSVDSTLNPNQSSMIPKNTGGVTSATNSGSAMNQSQSNLNPQSGNTSGTYINFDNPSVQKALDSLMSSGGPNLLKNISMGNSGPGNMQNNTSMGVAQNMQQGQPGSGQMNMFPQANSNINPNLNQNMNQNMMGAQNQGGYRHPLMGTQVGNQAPYFNPRGNAPGGGMRYM